MSGFKASVDYPLDYFRGSTSGNTKGSTYMERSPAPCWGKTESSKSHDWHGPLNLHLLSGVLWSLNLMLAGLSSGTWNSTCGFHAAKSLLWPSLTTVITHLPQPWTQLNLTCLPWCLRLTFFEIFLNHSTPFAELSSYFGKQSGVILLHEFLPFYCWDDLFIKCINFLPRRKKRISRDILNRAREFGSRVHGWVPLCCLSGQVGGQERRSLGSRQPQTPLTAWGGPQWGNALEEEPIACMGWSTTPCPPSNSGPVLVLSGQNAFGSALGKWRQMSVTPITPVDSDARLPSLAPLAVLTSIRENIFSLSSSGMSLPYFCNSSVILWWVSFIWFSNRGRVFWEKQQKDINMKREWAVVGDGEGLGLGQCLQEAHF